MKHLTLSNGATINAFVGDGFDGGSGVFVRASKAEFKGDSCVVPEKDRNKVIKLLDWYIKKEMELREYEGKLYSSHEVEYKLKSFNSPYDGAHWRGELRGRRRAQ